MICRITFVGAYGKSQEDNILSFVCGAFLPPDRSTLPTQARNCCPAQRVLHSRFFHPFAVRVASSTFMQDVLMHPVGFHREHAILPQSCWMTQGRCIVPKVSKLGS
jgi:hypothetical protein